MAAGCSGGGGDNSAPPPGPQAADDGFLFTVTAALSEGQLTLNNPWTAADLAFENITIGITYEGVGQPAGRVRPYTTLVQQYRVRRKQCEEDALVLNSNGEPSCYPILVRNANPVASRYGYYCGRNHPPHSAFSQSGAPEPLDGVDYCCRLHDARVWDTSGLTLDSECGMVMCLSKASGLPANVIALLPDVEEARQYWYGNGIAGGAALVCPGNQSNDARPPILGP
jgi:hypothetical protein